MTSINNIMKKYQAIALSDKQLMKLVKGRANLILYPDLHKYETIDEVLEPFGAAIILYVARTEPNIYGHWTCVFKVKS